MDRHARCAARSGAMDVATRSDLVAGVADWWNVGAGSLVRRARCAVRGCMSVASDAHLWNTEIEWVGAKVRLTARSVRCLVDGCTSRGTRVRFRWSSGAHRLARATPSVGRNRLLRWRHCTIIWPRCAVCRTPRTPPSRWSMYISRSESRFAHILIEIVTWVDANMTDNAIPVHPSSLPAGTLATGVALFAYLSTAS